MQTPWQDLHQNSATVLVCRTTLENLHSHSKAGKLQLQTMLQNAVASSAAPVVRAKFTSNTSGGFAAVI
jgi:hypothetical protein